MKHRLSEADGKILISTVSTLLRVSSNNLFHSVYSYINNTKQSLLNVYSNLFKLHYQILFTLPPEFPSPVYDGHSGHGYTIR